MLLDLSQPKTADQIMDMIDALRRLDDPGRCEQQYYTAFCRCMDGGQQWISRESMGTGYQRFVNKAESFNQNKNQPMLTTVNRITRHIRRVAAVSRPSKFDITGAQLIGVPSVKAQADSTIFKMAAGVGLKMSGYITAAQRSSFERHITGMHGHGFRYVKYPNGQIGFEQFDFDGYQLSLDPMNTSTNLLDHNYVHFTCVLTFDHAVRLYGKEVFDRAGIKEDDLPTIGTLLPVEVGIARMSGGRMYQHYAQQANTKGIVVTESYFKDSPERFGIRYVMADTGAGSANPNSMGQQRRRVLLNPDMPINPYLGTGMPMGLNSGWERTNSRFPISTVGLMVDDQIKNNLSASIWFQGLWMKQNPMLVVDKNSLAGNTTDPDSVWDQVSNGVMLLQRTGERAAITPQYLSVPEPSIASMDGFMYFSQQIRDSGFQSDLDEGKLKSHVPASTSTLSAELTALPLEDQQNNDIRGYESVIECLGMCTIGLAVGGEVSVIKNLKNAGMTDHQLSRLSSIDVKSNPCSLRLAREHIVRRSRSRMAFELQFAVNAQSISPEEYRKAMADIDLPLVPEDKRRSSWLDEAILGIVLGEEYEPIPLGKSIEAFKSAIEGAMMEHHKDPEVLDRLRKALGDQLETSLLLAEQEGMMVAAAQGGQASNAPPAAESDQGLAQEIELKQLLGG